ncbi:MAG: hypothetical protein ACI87E_000192 [Mariniblastus sp.]|jgi:uncharacterized protein YbaR (Trm112 family)
MSTKFAQDLIEMLRCPVTQSPLMQASAEIISNINTKIDAGSVVNQIGQTVTEPLESGFVNESGSLLLPVRGGIVILVSDQAISLN